MANKLNKYSYFILYSKTYTAEDLRYLVLDQLVRYYGIPKAFITDRDKLFTSNFYRTLVVCIGIKHKLSITYHLTTDG